MRYKPEWLALVREAPIEPALPILDCHHHLYDDPVRNASMGRFMLDEFLQEIAESGHKVVGTVYAEAYHSFLDDGPEAFRSVGETRTANAVGEAAVARSDKGPRICAGIISNIDLLLGDQLEAVLDAHLAAAPQRLRGVRDHTASDSAVPMPYKVAPDMLRDPKVIRAVEVFARRGLSWDVYIFHPQLADVAAVARAVPQATVVLNHVGTPLAVERFQNRRSETFREWRAALAEVAALPNVRVKLAGMLADYCGGDFEGQPQPPTSETVAAATGDYYRAAIDLFGPKRAMFASNFPRDRISVSYGVLWNAYKRIAADFSAEERLALFHDTAAEVYRLPAAQPRATA